MSDEFPEGWSSRPLAELFDINPHKPSTDALPQDTAVTFVPMPAVDGLRGEIVGASTRPFGEVRKGYTAFADKDVILAKITPCFENGKAAVASNLANGIGFGSSEFYVFRSKGAITPDYLFHYVRQERFRTEAADFMTGTAGQARVPPEYIRGVELPFPPLGEQRRIVVKIGALLADVNRARERLDRVPLILKRFRRAVLAAACSGELTKDWRNAHSEPAVRPPPNSVGDDELENSDAFSEIPASWAWIALDDACDAVIDYRGRTPPVDPRGKIPHVRTTNVRGGRIDWNTDSFVTEAVYKEYMTRGIPRLGDVIFTMEAPLGDAAVVDRDEKFSLAQRLLLLRGKKDLLDGSFLAYSLQSRWVHRSIEIRATGTTVLGIAYKRFRYVRLPVAPVPEQREIVRRVHEFFALADAIERRVKAAMARAERLPQAILSKAFAGELVPTEAELARAEGRTYETAEELLRRVTGSEASEPKTRPKARKRKSA